MSVFTSPSTSVLVKAVKHLTRGLANKPICTPLASRHRLLSSGHPTRPELKTITPGPRKWTAGYRCYMQDTFTASPSSELVPSDAQRRTIYALSTPPGKAGVAVVRISGPEALEIWRSMVKVSSRPARHSGPASQPDPEPWRMYRADILHPETRELLDSGLAVYFKGSHPSPSQKRSDT